MGSRFTLCPLPTQLGVPGRMRSWRIQENFPPPTHFGTQDANIFPGPSSLPPTKELKRTQIPELPLLSQSPGCSTSARRTGRSLRGTVRHTPQTALLSLSLPGWMPGSGVARLPAPHLPPPPQTHGLSTRRLRFLLLGASPIPAPAVRCAARRVGVLRGDHGCRLLPPVPTVTIESHGCPGDAGPGRALLTAPRQLQFG